MAAARRPPPGESRLSGPSPRFMLTPGAGEERAMAAHQKIAIVTGAGTGVGRAAALAMMNAGYAIALAGRRLDKLEETARMATAGAALPVATDVADVDQVNALFDRTVAHFGRLDVVFNNAGRNAPGVPLEDLDPTLWREIVDVNLSGMFYGVQAAFRVMKAQDPMGGRIINNGSVSAHAPRPNSIPYTATKHAVTGITKSAALDGRKYNIACGQIDIGNAATEMTERMAQGVPQANGEVKVEPLMDVDHVGQAILQMAELPLESNILNMAIMATKMPWVGRG
jgi:NAD(P)-dependent dehydrogenase (short-subunit alcohol dehydrogenase family)